MTRRQATRNLLMWMAGSAAARAQSGGLPAIDDLVNVFEFEPVAKAKIPFSAYEYVASGVDDEWTLRRNREAFQQFLLRPRFLRDTSKMDLSLELFGTRIEMPILVAPTGSQGLSHPEGEMAMARAAGAVKTVMIISSAATHPIEKIAAAATGTLWFQLYPAGDLDGTRERVERAVGNGCKAICFTVDTQYGPNRERLLRDRSAGPPSASAPTRTRQQPGGRGSVFEEPAQYRLRPSLAAKLTWSFLDQLYGWAKVPVLVKGILTAEDALLCVKHGAAGILVSNHGGRRLDRVPSSIEVLPEIAEAVGGKIPILIDSGFRRGTDILKALALGAKAVLVGRPPVWGLGAYGEAGAQRVLELLQTELARDMGLAGCANLAAIDRGVVRRER
jgi:isopentenyl diphosphate isomerase/L-lactate dehydrogenase-like FMN-dependent dehydrogenase